MNVWSSGSQSLVVVMRTLISCKEGMARYLGRDIWAVWGTKVKGREAASQTCHELMIMDLRDSTPRGEKKRGAFFQRRMCGRCRREKKKKREEVEGGVERLRGVKKMPAQCWVAETDRSCPVLLADSGHHAACGSRLPKLGNQAKLVTSLCTVHLCACRGIEGITFTFIVVWPHSKIVFDVADQS